jgi:hypothetical protein
VHIIVENDSNGTKIDVVFIVTFVLVANFVAAVEMVMLLLLLHMGVVANAAAVAVSVVITVTFGSKFQCCWVFLQILLLHMLLLLLLFLQILLLQRLKVPKKERGITAKLKKISKISLTLF